jgi:hypothetical protein
MMGAGVGDKPPAASKEGRFTIRRIVWSEDLAEAEGRRLSELNAG